MGFTRGSIQVWERFLTSLSGRDERGFNFEDRCLHVDGQEHHIVLNFQYENKYTPFFYKNIFYKNIEAEICEILRIF